MQTTEVKQTHRQSKYVQGWLKCPSSAVTLATELSIDAAGPTLQNMAGVSGSGVDQEWANFLTGGATIRGARVGEGGLRALVIHHMGVSTKHPPPRPHRI